jgi:hypothetical protein
MRSPIRLAAALLLIYPALMLVGRVAGIIYNGWSAYLLLGLPLVLSVAIVGVSLWRGRRWAYPAALVFSAGLGLILVLYKAALSFVWGAEAWEDMSIILWVLAFLPEAALACAFILLIRAEAFTAERRRALTLLAVMFAVEVVLMALMARFGTGGWPGSGLWYQRALRETQMPGELILSQMGLCCGYENETIISDVVQPHWGTITRQGIPTLVVANTLGLAVVYAVACSLLMRLRRRFGVPRMGAVAAQ